MRISVEETANLLDDFRNIVAPWCKKNGYSLHDAFEVSRESDKPKYEILIRLWSFYVGKSYLRSYFRTSVKNQLHKVRF